MIFTLEEVTSTRLRYKAVAENNANSESGVIVNAPGGSPGFNLALDSFASTPLRTLVSTAAPDTAHALKILQGEGLTLVGDASTVRAHVTLTPIAFDSVNQQPVQWIVVVDVGDTLDSPNSNGFACVSIEVHCGGGDGVIGAAVYVDVVIV